jgi:hypothetical protein
VPSWAGFKLRPEVAEGAAFRHLHDIASLLMKKPGACKLLAIRGDAEPRRPLLAHLVISLPPGNSVAFD